MIERPPGPLGFLLYASTATRTLSLAEMNVFIERCRHRNAWTGLSGLLVRRDGRYVQFIEGPPAALDRLYGRICSDERHTDVATLASGTARRALFPAWSMYLLDVQMQPAPARDPLMLSYLERVAGRAAELRAPLEALYEFAFAEQAPELSPPSS